MIEFLPDVSLFNINFVYFVAAASIGIVVMRRFILEYFYLPYKGRFVAITGCDSGFGELTALELVRRGATVLAAVLQDTSIPILEERAVEIGRESGGRLFTKTMNVADEASREQFVSWIKAVLRIHKAELHAFVNNAGVFAGAPSEWIDDKTIKMMMDVNAYGPLCLTNKMLPLLHRSKGRLVGLSSISGLLQGSYLSVYGASKAALDHFYSGIRVENQRGFSVHLINPGGFKTPLLNPTRISQSITKAWNETPIDVRYEYGKRYLETFRRNWSTGVVKHACGRLDWVVDSIIHACFGRFPRDRYYAGYDAVILLRWLTMYPTWAQDLLLSRMNSLFLKSNGVPVKMACQEKNFVPFEDLSDEEKANAYKILDGSEDNNN